MNQILDDQIKACASGGKTRTASRNTVPLLHKRPELVLSVCLFDELNTVVSLSLLPLLLQVHMCKRDRQPALSHVTRFHGAPRPTKPVPLARRPPESEEMVRTRSYTDAQSVRNISTSVPDASFHV